MFYNLEIKARTSEKQQIEIRKILKEKNAKFIGTDNQKDIYFKNGSGKLKLRKGNLENYLIYYERENEKEIKKSKVILFNNQGRIDELEKRTKKTYEILIQVNKIREIYFIGNVKFHIDKIKNLGNFVEIEASSRENLISEEKLREQCNYYKNLLKIPDNDLIKYSYSDMLLRKN